ncbi:MAG: helicase-related protein, partial [Phycisphaerae bacterium]
YMNDPVDVNVSHDKLTVDEVDQSYVTAERFDKFRLLRLILKHEDPPVCIVFCNTKHMARKLAKKLHDSGVNVKEIHGDLDQRRRERVMDQFRKHRIKVLVATDLAARGIDVSEISHIINYDIPVDSEIYVHRIGRTARMGAPGTAITFVTREEGKELTNVEMLINRQIPPREVPDFIPRPPREEPEVAAAAAPVSRFQAPVSVSTAPPPARKPAKTLGGRFRTARRRRRL